jgi:hypothetical protein
MGKKSEAVTAALASVEGSKNEWLSAKERDSIKPGWAGGATWDAGARKGEIVSGPIGDAEGPDIEGWSKLLKLRGLDPDVYEIDGSSIKWTSWDGWRRDPVEYVDDDGNDAVTGLGKAYSAICYSFKANVRLRRGMSDGRNPDWDAFLAETRKATRKNLAPFKRQGRAVTLVVNLADFQIGNPDGGGIEEQFYALTQIAPGVTAKVAEIKKRGDHVDEIIVAGLGDLVEGCTGFYPNMELTVELDHREQAKLVRRFLRDFLIDIRTLAESIIVTTVPGNHGERRKEKGGSYSTVGDNTDVEVFEQVAEALAMNPDAFGHIEFRIPNNEIAVTYATKGHVVSWTHGHKALGGGGQAATKLFNWWKGQAFGRAYAGVADSSILVAGHYHHLNVLEQEGRLLFIAPSLTDVNDFFADGTGYRSNPGVLVFELVEGVVGVEKFDVLRFQKKGLAAYA